MMTINAIEIVRSSGFDIKSLRKERRVFPLDSVLGIVEDVRIRGDKALLEYTKKFDRVALEPSSIRVTGKEISDAYGCVEKELLVCLSDAMQNIEKFQRSLKGKDTSIDVSRGIRLSSIIKPVENIGAYVPGGTASYVSTVYMIGIPAKIAGCTRRVLCTPPQKDGSINPAVLVAADMSGFSEIYKVGGAQAIAAMAYGTESVKLVDKIFGPGNIYVNAAKMIVQSDVAIDMVAGPSELMVIADSSGNAKFIASDMISQSEHDALSSSVLVTDSENIAILVQEEITHQLKDLDRKDIAIQSLSQNSKIIVAESIAECIALANEFAPEHLEIMTKDDGSVLKNIKNAGSVFVGSYSSVVLGDYASGTNHVLPTMGFAKSMSGLSIDDFVRRMEVSEISKGGISQIGKTVIKLAELEGLGGHSRAVRFRMEELR